MLNCEQVTALLSDWLDGELSPEASSEVEAHLKNCPACRSEAEKYRRTRELLRDAALPAPDALSGRVLQILRAEQKQKKKRLPIRALSTVAACMALALILIVVPYMHPAKTQSASDDNGSVLQYSASVLPECAAAPGTGAESPQEAEEEGGDMEVEDVADAAGDRMYCMAPPLEEAEGLAESKMSSNGSIALYVSLYAPDYEGQIGLLVMGSAAEGNITLPPDAQLLSEAANYDVYLLPCTQENRTLLTDDVPEDFTFIFEDESLPWILFVNLK